jgi:phospholipid/cholesterol/gamma-HCH transport system substrate-binding protein
MSRPSDRWHKTRRRLGGVAFLAVLALAAWLSVLLYGKTFSRAAFVTLYTDSVGNEMHAGAQVMVRGVQVGEVRQVTTTGHGARLELAIQPSQLGRLPANVTAQMLPTTLFGERYVDLILPARPAATTLAGGSVIGQDRSADALELERVLNNLLPLLRASEPDKLSVTLTAIARGLQGRGTELGHTLVTLDSYLRQMNPKLPGLDTDIAKLVQLTHSYRQALPGVLQALNDFSITSQTLADDQANYAALLSTLTTASQDLHAFLAANSANLIKLSTDSTSTLSILARYAPEFPCVLSDLVKFEPHINKILGQGTRRPGLHVHVIVVPSLGRYVPGKDTPVYGDNLGPHCYPVPFKGIRLHDGTSAPRSLAPASGTAAPVHGAAAATRAMDATPWLAGSPQESELVTELAGLSLHQPPASLPRWGGLLIAPLYRGTEVIVR